jgi:tetratricopeptide (TPR) repeat protein
VLKKAIAAQPDDPGGYVALAELYIGAQRYGDALQVLRGVEQRFPDNLEIVFQEGAALERSKQFDAAEAAFHRVIAKDPLYALALNYLGYMMADRGERLDEAVGYIKRALAAEPRNGAYLDSLGWAYFKQNKLDLAEENLRTAAAARTRDSAIQDHYGDVLEKRGRYAEAVAAWERALAGDGEQVDRSAIERKIKTAKGKIKPR